MFKSKKSLRKKGIEEDVVPVVIRRPPPGLGLLPDSSFRQSLILPHLTARFQLLRTGDGNLVDFSTMQAHLALQRQTGRLTGFEVDAVLQQYAQEAAVASPKLPSDSPSLETGSWSQGEPSLLNVHTASIISTTSSSPYAPSSIGGHSSAVPFPYDSPSPPPESPIMSPNNSNPLPGSALNISNFRRGGNSMFGGNVKSFAQLKMTKSASQSSIKSLTRERSGSEGKESDGGKSFENGRGKSSEEDQGRKSSLETEDQEVLGLTRPQNALTQSQFNRISRVLDDFEMELAQSHPPAHLRRSPNMSDTESIDPHYARLAPSPIVSHSNFRRPSATSLESSYTLTSGPGSPVDSNHEVLGRQAYHQHERTATATPTSYASLHAPDGRTRSISAPEDRENGFERSLRSSIGSSIGSPNSGHFQENGSVPLRVGELGDVSDENPFDLSYTSNSTMASQSPWRNDALVEQDEKEEDEASTKVNSRERNTMRDSDGSSYRPEDESDPEITNFSPPTTATTTATSYDHLIPGSMVEPEIMMRKSSEDLVNDLRGENEEDDLALEDLVAIQTRLVRNASRRAAKRQGTDFEIDENLESTGMKTADSFDWRASGLITSLSDAERLHQFDSAMEEEETLNITNSAVIPPTLLAAPVILDPPPRTARNSPRRDPTIRQSVLVRDVRNQANAATIALRKSPISTTTGGGGRLVKSKSIRNLSISDPIFVSGPSDIPAVPILNSQFGQGLVNGNKAGEGHSRKKSSGFGSSGGGMGFKFRLLVKKGSKENGLLSSENDITPFVGEFEELKNITPPFTPPSPFNSVRGTDVISTPSDYGKNEYPRTPEARSPFPTSVVPSPMPHEDYMTGKSPALSLNRLVSRLRRPKKESIDIGRISEPSAIGTDVSDRAFEQSLSGSDTKILHLPIPTSPPRRKNEDIEIGLTTSPASSIVSERQATTYDIRRGRGLNQSVSEAMDTIAPLSVKKVQTDSEEPTDEGRARKRISTTSMKKLWRVAKDLGLEEDGIEEFVKASYGDRESRFMGVDFLGESMEDSPHSKNRNELILSDSGSVLSRLNQNGVGDVPLSPGKSLRSFRSDGEDIGYDAGSVFDLYGDEDSEDISPISPREYEYPHEQRYDHQEEETFRGDEFDLQEEEEYAPREITNGRHPPEDSTLFTALSHLRTNRPASPTFPTPNHFRPDSMDSQSSVSPATTVEHQPKEKFSELVSRHRRNQSSVSNFQPSFSHSSRNSVATSVSPPPSSFLRETGKLNQRLPSPSIYFREEKRLANLDGGIAGEEQGAFLVRTNMSGAFI